MAEYGMFDDEIGVQISNGCGGSITGLSLTSLIGVGRCASWEWVVLTDTEHDFGTIHASIVKRHKSFFLEACLCRSTEFTLEWGKPYLPSPSQILRGFAGKGKAIANLDEFSPNTLLPRSAVELVFGGDACRRACLITATPPTAGSPR
jgi:hypothetical protein